MPDDRLLMHVAGRVLNTPLLVAQAKLNAILGFLGPRVGLPQAVSPGDSQLPVLAQPRPLDTGVEDPSSSLSGIGIIRIFGTLVHRTKGFEGASGILSYEQIRSELNAHLSNPTIRAILLEVDSSGGEVAGAFDLVEEIYRAREVKPIIALSNEHAFSGAYAIASAAEELFIARTGGVGSIGVLAVHMDQSQYDAKNGFKYTALFEGARKNDFSPHEPLSDAALGAFQERLRSIYDLFVMTVARNRGLDPAAVRRTEAGLYFGADGVREGLADKVMSRTQALEYLAAKVEKGGIWMAGKATHEQLTATPGQELVEAGQSELAQVSAEAGASAPQETVLVEHPVQVESQAGFSMEALKEQGIREERARVEGILEICHSFQGRLPDTLVAGLVKDGIGIDEARRRVLAELAQDGAQTSISNHVSPTTLGRPYNPLLAEAQRRAQAANGGK